MGGRLVFAPGATGAKTRREPMVTKYGATIRVFNRAGIPTRREISVCRAYDLDQARRDWDRLPEIHSGL